MAAPTLVSSWYAYYSQDNSLACAKIGRKRGHSKRCPARRHSAAAIVFVGAVADRGSRLSTDRGRMAFRRLLIGRRQRPAGASCKRRRGRAPCPLALGLVPSGAGFVVDAEFGASQARSAEHREPAWPDRLAPIRARSVERLEERMLPVDPNRHWAPCSHSRLVEGPRGSS